MQINVNYKLEHLPSEPGNWLPGYPNPADFRFDYFKLLENAPEGLAAIDDSVGRRVAIVGAGCAGMTAARELHRCGFDVTIYEASERIGGRLFTRDNPTGPEQTGMEMGAMRMPFFSLPGSKNSILEYYMMHEDRSHAAAPVTFPNPGSAPGGTGIYMNGGLGPKGSFDKPTMIDWPAGTAPDNKTIASLAKKATKFIGAFENNTKNIYTADDDRWEKLWAKIVEFYEPMTFGDLVRLASKKKPDLETGDFGGFGMNESESNLLYTIGTGDGSWGAFYSVSALWFIRCTMFGFGGSELQTVAGYSDQVGMPHYGDSVQDSDGRPLPSPRFRGIQSLVEYLYFVPAPGSPSSLYDADNVQLYSQSHVSTIAKLQNGKTQILAENQPAKYFDHVFVTSGQWASQMSFQLEGFSQDELPLLKTTAEHVQHNISSCKLFFPLKTKYWNLPGNRIPQVIVTDTFLQDAYALDWDECEGDTGVMLASYTWEDDSLKLLPFSEEELVAKVIEKIREITVSTVGQDVTQHFVADKPVTLQWILQPSYDGCAKLYRQRNESFNQIDLAYNQYYGGKSNLYFVGENYSVEGGWTEPALRSALDGVLRLLDQNGAEFKVRDFDFTRDYPSWPEPTESS